MGEMQVGTTADDWEKQSKKQFIAIDLKSFYASVEAADRGFDPLNVNLVVADESRTDKTICLAVSPSLKAMGVPGRGRLFEAKQRVREVNCDRQTKAPGCVFTGKSVLASALAADPSLELDLIIAPPRMRLYMDYSRRIVEIYLRYVSAEDLLVYSIDEVFIDATPYLSVRKQSAVPVGGQVPQVRKGIVQALHRRYSDGSAAGNPGHVGKMLLFPAVGNGDDGFESSGTGRLSGLPGGSGVGLFKNRPDFFRIPDLLCGRKGGKLQSGDD